MPASTLPMELLHDSVLGHNYRYWRKTEIRNQKLRKQPCDWPWIDRFRSATAVGLIFAIAKSSWPRARACPVHDAQLASGSQGEIMQELINPAQFRIADMT
jgi:hypothetical protein